jgi:5'-3' exonuclease
MGIPQFLQELLSSAGRPLELTAFSDDDEEDHRGNGHHRHRRDDDPSSSRLRVAVDVSSWIYRACMGFSDMLGDERHLTNLGRADLLKEQQQHQIENDLGRNAGDFRAKKDDNDNEDSHTGEELEVAVQQYVAACTQQVMKKLAKLRQHARVLVVLDGATPPIKTAASASRAEARREFLRQRDNEPTVDPSGQDVENRIRAFKRAGAGRYYSKVVANLVHECRHSRIPFLVAPYEADGQLGYLSDLGLVQLVVSEDSDLMACGCSHVLYKMDDGLQGTLLRRNDMFAAPLLQDFSTAMLAIVFASCGGDYCDKLRGIGFKTAVKIVHDAYFASATPPAIDDRASIPMPPLQRVLHRLFSDAWDSQSLTQEFKSDFERKFLSALLMYRHPVVFDPLSATTVVARSVTDHREMIGGGLDPELSSYAPYVAMYRQHLHSVVGDLVPRPLCIYVAEGWISPRNLQLYPMDEGDQHLVPTSVREYVEKPTSRSEEEASVVG